MVRVQLIHRSVAVFIQQTHCRITDELLLLSTDTDNQKFRR